MIPKCPPVGALGILYMISFSIAFGTLNYFYNIVPSCAKYLVYSFDFPLTAVVTV